MDAAKVSSVAAKVGVSEQVVRSWQRAAELEKINGVGIAHLNLLLLAGVSSCPDLATRSAPALHATIDAMGAAHEYGPTPSVAAVAQWIAAAS